jgi:hypothetical protein
MILDKNSSQFKEFEKHMIKSIYEHVLLLSRCVLDRHLKDKPVEAFQHLSTLYSFIANLKQAYQTEFPLVNGFLEGLLESYSDYFLSTNKSNNSEQHLNNFEHFFDQINGLFNLFLFLEVV